MLPLRGHRWGSTRRAATLRRAAQLCTLAALVGTVILSQQRASADPVSMVRLSVSPLAGETNGPSGAPLISADGSTVAFQSAATDLVPGDTNGVNDVFAEAASGGPPQLISQAPDGEPADGPSMPLAISATGRYVVFASRANDLGPAVPSGVVEIYLFDRQTGATELVSRATSGAPGNQSSGGAAISANGRFVVFASAASNLVGGDTNGVEDVFVRDRSAHTTTRVDVGPRDAQANGAADPQVVSINADGSVIAYASSASNLVPRDASRQWDVFVRNLRSGTTSRVSTPQPGQTQSGPSLFPSLSADGNVVAFESLAPLTGNDAGGSWDIFVRNRATGSLARVPVPSSGPPQLSADGSTIGFLTTAAPLVPAGAVGVATWSRTTGNTALATVDSAGDASTGRATAFSIDGNGGELAFATSGADLLPGDLNGLQDVYVHIAPPA